VHSGVLTGTIGGSYSPFPRPSTYYSVGPGFPTPPLNFRDSIASSDVAIDLSDETLPSVPYLYSDISYSGDSLGARYSLANGRELVPNHALLWEKENAEPDDYLHDPDPVLDRMLDRQMGHFSVKGVCNVIVLATIIIGLVGAFMAWPIWA
jgi:hypothetical protein